MSALYGKGLKGKATRLHSLVVRSRGACERCGGADYTRLQCAHIVPRRYNATRTNENAAWCLCAGCHLHTTAWASAHMELVESTIGMPAYEELRRTAERGVKTNDAFWQAEIDRLTPLLRREVNP